MRRLLIPVCIALLGIGVASAQAAPGQKGSLPSVDSGPLPGPPLLYKKPPKVPVLSVRAPWKAKPLLVSGTDAYRAGEYLYQDYLFDDFGANTVPLQGSHSEDPSSDIAAPKDGDLLYPDDPERFAENAADIVELRIKAQRKAVLYRLTLNTLLAKDSTVVGIGIDTDNSGGAAVEWPLDAKITSPGLDQFITAWGTGAQVQALPSGEPVKLGKRAVRVDTRTNQMQIRVPKRLMDPGRGSWRYVAGTGVWDGDSWAEVLSQRARDATRPVSGGDTPAPPVANLAFRFTETQHFIEEPLIRYDTFPASGIWFEADQANTLADFSSGEFFADVDFGKLAKRHTQRIHRPPGQERARIAPSRIDIPEGIHPGEFPGYGGRIKPYLITVPPNYRTAATPQRRSAGNPTATPNGAKRAKRVGLTFTWHSLGGTYTQYAGFSPNQLRQFGDQRNNILVSPHGYGTDGWYTDEAEADVFEVWADVAHHYKLDPERTYPSGYSMGGYGTYKLASQYPDLWARAYTTVGPPANGIWLPPGEPSGGAATNSNLVLENVRWIPFMNWAEVTDELVPYTSVQAQLATFNAEGLRNELWSFFPGEHFTLALLDQWDGARDFLGDATVVRDPWRVNYAFVPEADRPELGMVHDHAYWVSKLRVRDDSGAPARGEIDARSMVTGETDPITSPVVRPDPGPPIPSTVLGTDWTEGELGEQLNKLVIDLENVASGEIDGARAKLSARKPLTVEVTSDGQATLELVMPVPAKGLRVTGGGAKVVTGSNGRIELSVAAGTTTFTITPR